MIRYIAYAELGDFYSIQEVCHIYKRDEQNRQKEQPTNKANGNRKSLGHLRGAKTIAR